MNETDARGPMLPEVDRLPGGIKKLITENAVLIGWAWGEPGKNGVRPKRPLDHNGNPSSYALASNFSNYARWRSSILMKWPAIDYAGVGLSMHAVAACGADALLIDIDECRDVRTGAIADWAMWIVQACQSYCEVSPSGKGLRIVGSDAGWTGDAGERQRAWILGSGKGELYRSSGWGTLTFNVLPGYEGLWGPIGEVASSLDKRHKGKLLEDGGGRTGKNNSNPYAPVEVIEETLGYLPNRGDGGAGDYGSRGWAAWNDIGMAIWRATEGSDEGLRIWDSWSRDYEGYGEKDDCERRWTNYFTSPPEEIGYGRIHYLAREAQRALGNVSWNGGDKFLNYQATIHGEMGKATIGMGPIEPAARTENGTETAALRDESKVAGANDVVLGEQPFVIRKEGGGKPHVNVSGFPLDVLVDMAEDALMTYSATMPVFQRGESLVTPVLRATDTFGDERTLSPSFAEIRSGAMPDILSQVAVWSKWDSRGKKQVLCDPPPKVSQALLDRVGRWRLPSVVGISTLPTFRPDGSLNTSVGYDPATLTYVMPDPTLDFGRIAQRLDEETRGGKAAAHRALDLLDELFVDFPFVGLEDRSVALSGLLTPVARGALDVVPLHAINAPEAGGGKTFLATLCGALTLGRPPHVFTKGENEAELEKRLGAVMMAGTPIAVIDNVNGTLDGSFLCVAVEQRLVMVRVLGLSKKIELANSACFFATGNNIAPTGDSLRRVLVCTLDPDVERPEFRKFSGNPRARMLRDREDYLVAALTVVRAHALAGFPGEALRDNSLASYGLWDRYVRAALLWLGRADPVLTMERSRSLDPERAEFKAGLELLMERQRIWRRNQWTVAQIISLSTSAGDPIAAGGMGPVVDGEKIHIPADEEANRRGLRDWLLRVGGDKRGMVDAHRVGMWMSRRAGRVSGVMKLQRVEGSSLNGMAMWRITTTLVNVNADNLSK